MSGEAGRIRGEALDFLRINIDDETPKSLGWTLARKGSTSRRKLKQRLALQVSGKESVTEHQRLKCAHTCAPFLKKLDIFIFL